MRSVEGRLENEPCFFGMVGAAVIAAFMPVLYAQRLGGPRLDHHPGLKSWYEALRLRPAFARVVTEIATADRELSAPVAGGRI